MILSVQEAGVMDGCFVCGNMPEIYCSDCGISLCAIHKNSDHKYFCVHKERIKKKEVKHEGGVYSGAVSR
jgi:hypothetical protein